MNLLRKAYFNPSVFALAALMLMSINHFIGIIGLNSHAYNELFESLAGVNLLLSFLLVIPFHKSLNRHLLLFCGVSFTVGMLAEVAGVNTGYPFGNYTYTPAFGWQVYRVPVIIGINWTLLSYVTGVVANKLGPAEWQKILAASFLMVVIDLLLENFAVRHHFWVWKDNMPPIQNYLSWFGISVVIQFGFRKLIPDSINPNAGAYLVILILFLFADLLFAYLT